MSTIVSMTGITRRFGAVTALDQVDLQVEAGKIHALVGENGAGKTTLMRILYGGLDADAGVIEVEGQSRHFRNSAEAIASGIGMVSQHYSIIPELTCLQNLMLGAEPGLWIAERDAEARATELATRMGFEFSWRAPAGSLSPAGAQKLEILKLLWRQARIMILDEPTAMLSPADGDALFVSLKQLAAEGDTIILVTHRLPEVLQHCSHVTVLRGGRNVAHAAIGEHETPDAAQLAAWIVGHEVPEVQIEAVAPGKPVLEIRSLRVRGDRGEEAVKGISLRLHEGEVVGLAGVDGNGQRELFQALIGVGTVLEGSVLLDGRDVTRDGPVERLRQGVRLIPEDRHEEGVVEDWSLELNAALGLQRLEPLRSGLWVDVGERRALAGAIAERFRTKHGGLGLPMRSLSGGNQQRFVAARALALKPRVILAFQPTRGLDIEGTLAVYAALRETCRREGVCAIVVSFDLDELLEQCDRVVAINGGALFEPKPGEERDRAAIGRLMVGAA
ncbi:MAG TPA: ABC transporter ATP-binding protein [Fimbriimonadaceae bacterium]|nr:ABC transporter ATP-binding protein [Fimbriimonadaceae bacterium]